MGKEKAENTAKTTHNGADNEGGERRAQREREGDDDVRPSGPPSCIDRRVCAPWGAGEDIKTIVYRSPPRGLPYSH